MLIPSSFVAQTKNKGTALELIYCVVVFVL